MLRDQRERGRRAILDTIRRAGRVARIDIAGATGISQATVTTITAELLGDGLIEEITRDPEAGEGRRGRPRVDLKLRGEAHLVAGVRIGNAAISVALMDFEGTEIGEYEAALKRPVDAPDRVTAQIGAAIDAACRRHGARPGDLSAIGVGLAGIVDAERGFVHWSPSFDQRNVAFAAQAGQALGKTVFLDNDANLVAMAEKYFGHGREVSDFLVVTIESGVGMGIVLKDEIYRGTRGCGAEFGHTKVHLDGALCRCGQRGCLEAYVADYALLREAAVADLLAGVDSPDRQVQAVLEAARGGDAMARSIVDRAGRMFAMGLANLVNIFDPQLIILSGERVQADHLYASEVIDSIKEMIVAIDAAPPKVLIHKWGNSMWARGAAAFALQEVAEMSLKDLGQNVA